MFSSDTAQEDVEPQTYLTIENPKNKTKKSLKSLPKIIGLCLGLLTIGLIILVGINGNGGVF